MATKNVIPFDLPGFEIDEVEKEDGKLIIKAHALSSSARCPDCGEESTRVHSYYTRAPYDLPCNGRAVQLILRVRRFRCLITECPRKTFAERLPGLVPVYGRRTVRLTDTLRDVSFALGGEAGARVGQSFRTETSADTLLRIIRATPIELVEVPRVLGIDDWAKRKGHNYGTLLVDLERQHPVDLLPDREAETLAQWLKAHPGVEIISRDRANAYIEGATKGAPGAIQIADRWHLLKNLSEALQKMLEKHPADLRLAAKLVQMRRYTQEFAAISSQITNTTLPASVEQPTNHRQKLFDEVMQLNAQGDSNCAIARQLHIDRRTAARYINIGELPRRVAPQNVSTVKPHLAYIKRRWREGCKNGRQLWREIQAQGYTGSYSSVRRAIERHLRSSDGRQGSDSDMPPVRPLSARRAVNLLVTLPANLTDEQHLEREMLCLSCSDAAEAYPLAQRFVTMIKEKQAEALDVWLQDAQASDVSQLRNFAQSLMRDYDAVKAALTFEWSNGPVEGQVNRLKLIKRQMYGRAEFDLLRQRVLYDSS
jgi:transposase